MPGRIARAAWPSCHNDIRDPSTSVLRRQRYAYTIGFYSPATGNGREVRKVKIEAKERSRFAYYHVVRAGLHTPYSSRLGPPPPTPVFCPTQAALNTALDAPRSGPVPVRTFRTVAEFEELRSTQSPTPTGTAEAGNVESPKQPAGRIRVPSDNP